ncbi:GntR family transcriptional regulator [Paraburkholderia hospita]|uniref:GntR family transcriptional regulator n=1 Tax=Paraburkholderia hospita TaxID=169430 RepID=A0ABN0FCG8_9BURK|nr:GntR family transcriptional regulator [Paraburkholderia hospita]EIM96385.1 GntR family transcriptional regulator [Paraburkholderia hospita]OUL70151.1 GntR family transcriptional regulator [Paraburkholderia hospita]
MQNDDQADEICVPEVEKVRRPRLHDTLVEELRRLIVEGVLGIGAKLNERELCEMLGISRTPLREALKALEVDGLIETIPNRGAFVKTMSDQELRENFELMSGLEALSGELACARITEHEIAEIRALHLSMVACRARHDLAGYYARNQAIHDRINEAARNQVLRGVYMAVNRRLQAARFRSNFRSAKWDHAINDHEEMLEALDSRDGIRLATILRQHLLDKRDTVLLETRADFTLNA